MKKLILSVAIASLALATNAVTNMRVKTKDGQVVKFDVENVTEVDFEEDSSTPFNLDVTVSGSLGNYTYVDLGLSVKWATYNVGATKPNENGDYFAWGETETKNDYSWDTYKLCNENNRFFAKYCTDSKFGTIDNLTVLEPSDDAAMANWGSGWRMPTSNEIKELLDGCDWHLVYDVSGSSLLGMMGTSLSNGNTIFLPATGCYEEVEHEYAGYGGYYWSSSLFNDNSNYAYGLGFDKGNIVWKYSSYSYRNVGECVRAVCE